MSSSFFFSSIMFPPAPSLLVNAVAAVTLVGLAFVGATEAAGVCHLQYSKFANVAASPCRFLLLGLGSGRRVSSKVGMVGFYAPALAAAIAAFCVPGTAANTRGVLVAAALVVHLLKRVLESLFVHKFSGFMILDSVILISFTYFVNTVAVIYVHHLIGREITPEPAIDLRYPGIFLFAVGVGGNLYHHVLLSRLRKGGEKGYKIPHGGLFGLVICPHYLFEIVIMLGISSVSQTLTSFIFVLGSAAYLAGRSYSTRKWYHSKFDNFPVDIKALVPYVL